MPTEVRFGVLGCGEIGMRTCEGISAAPNSTLAMLMDPRPEVLRDLAEFYAASTTTEADAVLSNPDVDAVYIAMPREVRARLGIEAARAGKHVLMENPMATTLADADALIRACEEGGVALGVAYSAQVDAGMAAARDLVRSGVLGEILSVRISGLQGETSSAGVLARLAEDLNTVGWVTGLEAVRVYAEYAALTTADAVGGTLRYERGAILVRYENQAIGVVHGATALPGGEHQDAPGPRIYGCKGQLILGGVPLVYLLEPTEGGRPKTWQSVRSHGPAGDRQQIVARFVASVLRGEAPPATWHDGRVTLEIIEAARRSSELRRPVELPFEL